MSNVSITWDDKALLAEVNARTEEMVQGTLDAIADTARRLCPVGQTTRGRRAYSYARVSRRQSKVQGSKFKIKAGKRVRVYSRGDGKSWEERKPGTLRDTIFTRLRWVDGVCLGWCKAGKDGSAEGKGFYAPFQELGTRKMKAHPFMRPALHAQSTDRITSRFRGL